MRLVVIGLLVSGLLFACTPGGTTPPNAIGPNGGSVASADGNATVSVPAGALEATTTVTVAAASNVPAAPSGKAVVPDSAWTVSGDATLTKPATLSIKVDPAKVAPLRARVQGDLSTLQAVQLLNGVWQNIAFSFDPATNVLTVNITGFGTYAVLVNSTSNPPANNTVSSIVLSCAATSLNVAATTTCQASARNSAGVAVAPQPAFTFTSSDTGKATVSGGGVVTGVAAGSSNITAVSSGVTSNAVAVVVNAVNPGGAQTIIAQSTSTATPYSSSTPTANAISPNGLVFYREFADAVVGGAYTASSRGWLWDNGTATQLPPLPSPYTSFNASTAFVNNSGNIVFQAVGATQNDSATLLYTRSTGTYTIVPVPADSRDNVVALNTSSTVYGRVNRSSNLGGNYFYRWNPGDAALTTLTGIPAMQAINDNWILDANDSGAVLLRNGVLNADGTFSAGLPSAFACQWGGCDLTNTGRVTGRGMVGGVEGAVVWQVGGSATLGAAFPNVYANPQWSLVRANNNGDAVFVAFNASNSQQFSYWLYRNSGAFAQLTLSDGWNFVNGGVLGISDTGAVLVQASKPASFGSFQYAVIVLRP
jgi:hypothetical protein